MCNTECRLEALLLLDDGGDGGYRMIGESKPGNSGMTIDLPSLEINQRFVALVIALHFPGLYAFCSLR